ncbi:mycofactocin-coupled SDR family oxidoreductase [Gordonia sp. NPDC127522]|uniref:mycofactocin-coupled SDR family oxidoreductase n=1 Tax=Gordonia sp. NPDC127522 TaxID=3345390 RepID=UPI00363E9DF6
MGRVSGKVAFITGAARGQGRSHALRLAAEGAKIVAADLCAQDDGIPYEMSSQSDLDETVRLVQEQGGEILARVADVRDTGQLDDVVRDGVEEFGKIDIVVANAGIVSFSPLVDMDDFMWQQMIDVNLTGVYKTARAGIKQMIKSGNGGSVVLTGSVFGLKGGTTIGHYVAAKHGVIGLAKAFANELGEHRIRVNAVLPTNVGTPMILNTATMRMWRPDLESPTEADVLEPMSAVHVFDKLPWVDCEDISNAVLYLASDEARYVTGTSLAVDAGCLAM